MCIDRLSARYRLHRIRLVAFLLFQSGRQSEQSVQCAQFSQRKGLQCALRFRWPINLYVLDAHNTPAPSNPCMWHTKPGLTCGSRASMYNFNSCDAIKRHSALHPLILPLHRTSTRISIRAVKTTRSTGVPCVGMCA